MLSSATISAQADVYVVASIKPIHSLVSAVMQGVGEPSLLIEGAGSPHNYALKPSQAYELQKANLIFWIGHDLEAFLQRTIENIAPQAVSVPLIESHGIKTLPFREGASFEEHDHDKHDEHDHDDENTTMNMTTTNTTNMTTTNTTNMTTTNTTNMTTTNTMNMTMANLIRMSG